MPLCGGAQPVADLEEPNLPTADMQPKPAKERAVLAQKYACPHVLAQQPLRNRMCDPIARLLNGLVGVGEGQPRADMLTRLLYRLAERLGVSDTIRAHKHALARELVEKLDLRAKLVEAGHRLVTPFPGRAQYGTSP